MSLRDWWARQREIAAIANDLLSGDWRGGSREHEVMRMLDDAEYHANYGGDDA